jgi:branched-chain amino acid transport system permease protein
VSTLLAQLVVSGALLGGMYALISLGLTLVYGSLHLINFAHGDYLMVAMYLAWVCFNWFHINPYLSILIVTPVMFVAGCLTYGLLIRPVLRSTHIVQVFITFGLGIIVQNVALIIFTGEERSIDIPIARSVASIGGVKLTYTSLIAFGVALAAAGLLYLAMRYTYLGKSIRATGQNPLAAQLVGINTNVARLVTFGVSSALLGIAGPMLIPVYSTYPTIGNDFILIIFIVIVLGGLGSYRGAIVGGLTIGVVQTLSNYYLHSPINQALLLLVLIVILVIRPSGLFGRARLVGSGGR